MVKTKGLTNVDRILLLLAKEGRMNTRQIALKLGKSYIYIRNLLYDMKRRKLVNCEYVKRFVPGLSWILMNEWWITDKGKEWLKKRGLL